MCAADAPSGWALALVPSPGCSPSLLFNASAVETQECVWNDERGEPQLRKHRDQLTPELYGVFMERRVCYRVSKGAFQIAGKPELRGLDSGWTS